MFPCLCMYLSTTFLPPFPFLMSPFFPYLLNNFPIMFFLFIPFLTPYSLTFSSSPFPYLFPSSFSHFPVSFYSSFWLSSFVVLLPSPYHLFLIAFVHQVHIFFSLFISFSSWLHLFRSSPVVLLYFSPYQKPFIIFVHLYVPPYRSDISMPPTAFPSLFLSNFHSFTFPSFTHKPFQFPI